MKVATVIAIAALAVSNVSAAAAPEAEAWRSVNRIGFCGMPGQACGKARRAANVIGAIVADANNNTVSPAKRDAWRSVNRIGFCGMPGQACGKMRRNVEDIGDALDDLVKRDAWRSINRIGFCGMPGQACGRSADAEAEAEAWRSVNRIGFCGMPGQACGKAKRDALPAAEAEAWRSVNRIGFCGMPGQACGKAKRAADAIHEHDPEFFKQTCFEEGNECDIVLKAKHALDQVKRDASAAADAWRSTNRIGFCGLPGQACGRDVHDFVKATEAGDEVAKRAEAECHGPDGECTVAEADLAKLEKAINSAVEALDQL